MSTRRRPAVETWPETWPVIGTSGHQWTVGRKSDGTWGCSCPAWTMQKKDKWLYDPRTHTLVRRDCQHIMMQKSILEIDIRTGQKLKGAQVTDTSKDKLNFEDVERKIEI